MASAQEPFLLPFAMVSALMPYVACALLVTVIVLSRWGSIPGPVLFAVGVVASFEETWRISIHLWPSVVYIAFGLAVSNALAWAVFGCREFCSPSRPTWRAAAG